MVLMNDKIDNIEYERVAFEGKIHLIDSDELMAKFAHECPKFTRLGFDTETRPSFKKGDNYKMALIQLSSDTDAYLFRLHYLTNFLPINWRFAMISRGFKKCFPLLLITLLNSKI